MSDSFNVGHADIDIEHHDLIVHANEMVALRYNGDYVACYTMFKKFSEKFDCHIAHEEKR